jgi:hypothetical protein
MHWSFAIVNNRLAEIFFDKTKKDGLKIMGHCYVTKEEYTTKQEQGWIKKDCENMRFIYRNKKYRRIDLSKMKKSA